MKVNVESISTTERKLDVWIPADEVKSAYDGALGELQRNAKLKGFRQGKAPRRIIESIFGKGLLGEVSQKLVEGSIEGAFEQVSLSPVSSPSVNPDEVERDGEFHYSVEFEVLPEFELGSYTGIKLEEEDREIGEEDIERVLKMLQERNASAKPLEEPRAVAKGDLVVVDYEGTLDGEKLPGLGKQDAQLVVGEEKLVPEFDEGIVGMEKGEEKEIEVTYGEDFQIAEAAGKTVKFKLRVKDVMERQLPEIDDEFAKDLGLDDLGALKARIKEDQERELENAKRQKRKNDVLDYLTRNHSFDIPRSLVADESARIRRDLATRFEGMGAAPPPMTPETEEEIEKRAERNVKAGIILGRIAEKESISATREEVDERLGEVAKTVNMPIHQVRDVYQKNNLMMGLESRLLEDKVIDFIIKNAEIGHPEGGDDPIDKDG